MLDAGALRLCFTFEVSLSWTFVAIAKNWQIRYSTVNVILCSNNPVGVELLSRAAKSVWLVPQQLPVDDHIC